MKEFDKIKIIKGKYKGQSAIFRGLYKYNEQTLYKVEINYQERIVLENELESI